MTPVGLRLALFFTRTYGCLLRPGLARVLPEATPDDRRLRPAFDRLETAMDA